MVEETQGFLQAGEDIRTLEINAVEVDNQPEFK
jgi:hypothetical protein